MSWIQEFVSHLRGVPKPGTGGRVLAIMPKDRNAEVLSEIASGCSWALDFQTSYDSALDMVKREPPPVILYDRDLALPATWKARIQNLARSAPDSCVILLSSEKDDQLWQYVIQLGGFDVLTKPFQRERVLRAIEFALRNNTLSNGV